MYIEKRFILTVFSLNMDLLYDVQPNLTHILVARRALHCTVFECFGCHRCSSSMNETFSLEPDGENVI